MDYNDKPSRKSSITHIQQETEATEKMLEAARKQSIKPGSPAMEVYLSAGYPDIATRAHALELIAERKKNPMMIPYEVEQRALAFLAALDANKPK